MGSSFGKRVLWCSYCNKYISSVMMESFYPKSVVSVVDTARLTDSRELSTSPPIRIPSLAPILRAQKLTNFSITEWGFIFSVNRESIFFRPRETGFRLFRDPWNMCLLSRDFWINDFCGNNFSLFLEILGSLKLVNQTIVSSNYDQTGCKTWPFDELADGGLRTNHSESNLEGLESAIMDKSLGTNLYFWRFCAHVRREYNFSCRPTSLPPPIQCWKLLPAISSNFQQCIEGEGKSNPFLKGKQRFFQTSVLKHKSVIR